METDQGTVKVESTPTNLKQRRPAGWVPYAGTKRKAHLANLGDHFDVDCRPSPAKQFAVDEDVAGDILRGGYYYDPSIPTPPVNENQPPSNEVEMEEGSTTTTGTYIKGIGEANSCVSMRETALADEKECSDDSVITRHSKHESQPKLPSKHDSSQCQSVMNGLSLVLSNEIQATLIRRRLNEDFILPKSIMDQVSGMNTSMALVPWKPPTNVETFIQESTLKEKLLEKKITLPQQNPETDIKSPSSSIPMSISIETPLQPDRQMLFEEDVEGMDVDDVL